MEVYTLRGYCSYVHLLQWRTQARLTAAVRKEVEAENDDISDSG